jgi:uncharacterized peroxidase-related enzyme
MPWIRTIEPEDATGDLADAYAWQARRLGRPTEFTQLGSLAPELVHARLALYKASERLESAITPLQKVVIAYVTSVLNETPHCASQVRLKLYELGADDAFVAALDAGRYDELPAAEAALATYARQLTRDVGSVQASDIDALRAAGFGDLEILDANNQCAHLNYVNRIANGLGLRTEVGEEFAAFAAIPA